MYHPVFYSAAFRSLSLTARALVFELIGLHDGTNNGEIFLSVRTARDLLGLGSDAPVTQAFRDLQEHGLIRLVSKGSFCQKASRASVWQLNFLEVGGRAATADYIEWCPKHGTRAHSRLVRFLRSDFRPCKSINAHPFSGAETDISDPAKALTVSNCDDENMQNPDSTAVSGEAKFGPHLVYHTSPAVRASVQSCEMLRGRVRRWLEGEPSRTQRSLSRSTGVSEVKISRLMRGKSGGKTIPQSEWKALFDATNQNAFPLKIVQT